MGVPTGRRTCRHRPAASRRRWRCSCGGTRRDHPPRAGLRTCGPRDKRSRGGFARAEGCRNSVVSRVHRCRPRARWGGPRAASALGLRDHTGPLRHMFHPKGSRLARPLRCRAERSAFKAAGGRIRAMHMRFNGGARAQLLQQFQPIASLGGVPRAAHRPRHIVRPWASVSSACAKAVAR